MDQPPPYPTPPPNEIAIDMNAMVIEGMVFVFLETMMQEMPERGAHVGVCCYTLDFAVSLQQVLEAAQDPRIFRPVADTNLQQVINRVNRNMAQERSAIASAAVKVGASPRPGRIFLCPLGFRAHAHTELFGPITIPPLIAAEATICGTYDHGQYQHALDGLKTLVIMEPGGSTLPLAKCPRDWVTNHLIKCAFYLSASELDAMRASLAEPVGNAWGAGGAAAGGCAQTLTVWQTGAGIVKLLTKKCVAMVFGTSVVVLTAGGSTFLAAMLVKRWWESGYHYLFAIEADRGEDLRVHRVEPTIDQRAELKRGWNKSFK